MVTTSVLIHKITLVTSKFYENSTIVAYIYECKSWPIHSRFSCDHVKSIQYMIAVFNIRTKIILFLNIFKFCDNGSILTWFLSESDREKNIKLSDGNTNNNSIIIKTRFFQQNRIYENLSTYWKIMASIRLKKILMRPCKKIWHITIILDVWIFSSNAYPNFVIMDQFWGDL